MIESLTQSGVVFFLGAGANLCDRPVGAAWTKGVDLPSGQELADYLATCFKFPGARPAALPPVAQYQIARDRMRLDQKLHEIFLPAYQPTSLHTFLAELPRKLRAKGLPRFDGPVQSRMIFMTTNYDGLLEEAFRRIGEPFHVFTYVFRGNGGCFWHYDDTTREETRIENPVNFAFSPDDHHSAIVKLHGAAHANLERQTFVIAEDQYIDYLIAHADMTHIPPALGKQFPHSRFVFLGYSFNDWTMRVLFQCIRRTYLGPIQSYAIQPHTDPVEEDLWRNRGVCMVRTTLQRFLETFRTELHRKLARIP